MANALYPIFKQQLLGKLHDMDTDDIRAVLIDSADYTYSAAHDFYNDVVATPAAAVAVSSALTSPTIALGVFDTADFTWSTVTGDQSEAIVVYNHNGNSAATDSARMLVLFQDTGITGMPITPNGGNINVTVNASGWFTL
jgi:hypothetical protein